MQLRIKELYITNILKDGRIRFKRTFWTGDLARSARANLLEYF